MNKASLLRWLMLASSAALALEVVLWELWLAPLRPGGSMLALAALPLIGMTVCAWRDSIYGLQLSCMMILIYLAEGVVRAMTEQGTSRLLGAIEIILVLVFFAASLAYLRPLKRQARAKV
jgi:uncharacterized membrane protein